MVKIKIQAVVLLVSQNDLSVWVCNLRVWRKVGRIPGNSFDLTNCPYGIGIRLEDFGSYDIPSHQGRCLYHGDKGEIAASCAE